MLIKDIKIEKIFDSRSNPTVEASIFNESGAEFRGAVPSGKSRGSREAHVAEFSDAKNSVKEIIRPHCIENNFSSIREFDDYLIKLDGTENKKKVGGNVILAFSIAFTRALAFERNKSAWEVMREDLFFDLKEDGLPMIFANLINGGAHADSNLDIQEYMVIANPVGLISEMVERVSGFYKKLGEYLKKEYKLEHLNLGDEAGYVLDLKSNFEPIQILENIIKREKFDPAPSRALHFSQHLKKNQKLTANFQSDNMDAMLRKMSGCCSARSGDGVEKYFFIGLDVAASNFYKDGHYNWEKKKISAEELEDVYFGYLKKSKLLYSIEDPFEENDSESFRKLKSEASGKLIIGDDLTTTNPEKIAEYSGAINGVIIKPNQIGSVSEACDAILRARENGMKVIISHRSGETEDNFIIHLAKASGADGVKIGAPARERMSKYNELIALYE